MAIDVRSAWNRTRDPPLARTEKQGWLSSRWRAMAGRKYDTLTDEIGVSTLIERSQLAVDER